MRISKQSLMLALTFSAGVIAVGCHDEKGTKTVHHSTPRERGGDPASRARAFSMDQFAWNHRPLLVFAPSGDDPRYQAQREAMEATRADFDERDMVWIEVLGADGPVRAAGQTLRDRVAAALRERFDVAPERFAVLLVGKDTTVKRRSDQAVEMASLYQQIDRMPMRRAEMRRRSGNSTQHGP